MTLTASSPTRDLLGALARRGWGDLAGREWRGLHAVLRGLADLLPYRSGEGQATAAQVADVASMSERWTRHLLAELEALGLVTWTRGGILDGRPQASLFRIEKRRLAEMLAGARVRLDEIRARRAARTAARLRGLRLVTVRPRRQRLGAGHPELTASPTPFGGGDRPASPAAESLHPTRSTERTADMTRNSLPAPVRAQCVVSGCHEKTRNMNPRRLWWENHGGLWYCPRHSEDLHQPEPEPAPGTAPLWED